MSTSHMTILKSCISSWSHRLQQALWALLDLLVALLRRFSCYCSAVYPSSLGLLITDSGGEIRRPEFRQVSANRPVSERTILLAGLLNFRRIRLFQVINTDSVSSWKSDRFDRYAKDIYLRISCLL